MIKENSFWTDEESKEEFIDNTTNLADSFWINVLGFIALYNRNKKFSALRTYLTQVELINFTSDKGEDKALDLTLSIKLLNNADKLKTTVARELSRFLMKLRGKKIERVDQEALRELLKRTPFVKIKPSVRIRPYIVDFLKGTIDLDEVVKPFFVFARKFGICNDFTVMARKMNAIKVEELEEAKRMSFKEYLSEKE